MWLNKAICVGNINQFDTNTCHYNKKFAYMLNHLHLIWDIWKSPINEYSDNFYQLDLHNKTLCSISKFMMKHRHKIGFPMI